ncbi:disulfide bond formation protein B [Thalassobaculum litoreum]|uniref:Disulfide bond formation protein DsbB n=1 Tax=Thalassobaculum litoreum DSM 18839 TaxID=1123362 RepID=A0A8G2EVC5_9PROT|nr:disulfide bond formation protein B [Thalassobaculum litoreum]SDF78663.1 disulfide bond formation protein DsbB [Thalassobaculum litoreum DSM 18839]
MAVLTPLFVAAAAAAALAAALISQYGFDLQPCVLCIWQRWPYLAAIGLGLAAIALRRAPARRAPAAARALTGLAILAVLVSGGIGGFHVGVEQGWWEGTSGCGSTSGTDDLNALRAQIMNAPIVRCDEVAFSLFGISMAGWNLLYALGVALVAIRAMLVQSNARPGA